MRDTLRPLSLVRNTISASDMRILLGGVNEVFAASQETSRLHEALSLQGIDELVEGRIRCIECHSSDTTFTAGLSTASSLRRATDCRIMPANDKDSSSTPTTLSFSCTFCEISTSFGEENKIAKSVHVNITAKYGHHTASFQLDSQRTPSVQPLRSTTKTACRGRKLKELFSQVVSDLDCGDPFRWFIRAWIPAKVWQQEIGQRKLDDEAEETFLTVGMAIMTEFEEEGKVYMDHVTSIG